MEATIHVLLLEEGTRVWRPVRALQDGQTFTILGPKPEGERWEFPPGCRVQCTHQRLSGEDCLVATGAILEQSP